MDWLYRMNLAMDYIENNICENIDFEQVSKLACCSAYNFQRMFAYITNISISEYIRRRRLTLVVNELKHSNMRIIDLAVKYGYDSHESFARAFQKLHGISPSTARNKGVILKAYPRLSFQITIKGDVEMNYRIEEGNPSKIFGKSIEVSFADEKSYSDIDAFVADSWGNGLRNKIREAAGYGSENEPDAKLLGIALHSFKSDGSYKFMLSAEFPETGIFHEFTDQQFDIVEIPKATWAVFNTACNEDEELDTINKIWRRLPEWFQSTGYQHAAGIPELEKCFKTPDGYRAEVWIPIMNA